METTFRSPIKDGVCCHIPFCHDVTFDVRNVVLYQGLNNHTKFGGSWLNSHEITARYGIQIAIHIAAICIITMYYICHRCVPNHGHNIPTKFGDKWSNAKEKETVSKVKMSATTKLNFDYLAFSTPCMYSVSKSQYPH